MISEPLKLSIVTPSYNHGQYLEQTILSVINQDYLNIEYIVIDGASRDNSVDIIRKYENEIFYWESEPDMDLRCALKKGFSRATGDVIAWQNADDYYQENVLGQVMRIFAKKPDVDLVYGNINIVDEENRILDKLCHIPLYYPLDLFGGLPFQNHAAFFRRSLWERAGGITFDELNYDVDLIFRLARKGHPYFVHQVLGAYRMHSASITFSGIAEGLQKDPWVIRRRFLGKWKKLPRLCFAPMVILAKLRRYLYLLYLGDWNCLLMRVKDKILIWKRKLK